MTATGAQAVKRTRTATPAALVPHQTLDLARGDWRLCTVRFSGARRGTDRFMPALGDTSRSRSAEVTLRHRLTMQEIAAAFVWDGAAWVCPERKLCVGAEAMLAAIGRGFAPGRERMLQRAEVSP